MRTRAGQSGVSLTGDAPFSLSLVPKFSSTVSESERAARGSGLRDLAKLLILSICEGCSECYNLGVGRVRQFTPLQGSPAFFLPLFTEVRGIGILGSSGVDVDSR